MRWYLEQAEEGLNKHRATWDSLNKELYGGNPYFDSRFILPLVHCFGKGGEYLCVHRDSSGAIDGLLILEKRRLGVWSLFQPSQAQILPVLVKSPDSLCGLFRTLGGFASEIDFVKQDPQFSKLLENIGDAISIRIKHALTINVEIRGTFEDYWAGRPKNLKKNIRRYFNRVNSSDYSLELRRIEDSMGLASAFDRYSALESRGWKSKTGTAINSRNIQGAFYSSVINEFSNTRQAVVYELYLGSRLIASRLCIKNKAMLIILKTTYDEEFSSFAPGRLLLFLLLQEEFRTNDVASVEFYTNANKDQLAWAVEYRYVRHVAMYRSLASYFVLTTLSGLKRNIFKREKFSNRCLDASEFVTIQRCSTVEECWGRGTKNAETLRSPTFDINREWFVHLGETAIAKNERPVVYSAVDGATGEALALLPLLKQNRSNTLQSMTNCYSMHFLPFVDPKRGREALGLILETIRKGGEAGTMDFFPVPFDENLYNGLYESLFDAGWYAFREVCFGNWYLPIRGMSYEQFYATLASGVRNTIQRKKKKFFAHGENEMILWTSTNDIEGAIELYNDVYNHSWKKPEPHSEFIPGLIRLLAARGSLRLGFAFIGGEVAAVQLWIVEDKKAYIYKLAYKEEFRHWSVGTLLTDFMFRQAIDIDEVDEIDYLKGDEPYKTEWMEKRRVRWRVRAYNPDTIKGKWQIGTKTVKQGIKARLNIK